MMDWLGAIAASLFWIGWSLSNIKHDLRAIKEAALAGEFSQQEQNDA